MYPGTDASDAEAMVDEIAAVGANTVALVVSWRQRTVKSNSITRGDVTVDDDVLRAAITRAHTRGLTSVVFPILLIDRTTRGQWRGTVRPTDVSKWWLSYEQFILHYADIAADERAGALIVGSELSSTETWRDRWYHLVGKVERRFDGTLIYSANWDHYTRVSFWRRVDVIGVTGYQPLSRSKTASTKQLQKSWNRAKGELEVFAEKQAKPLWLTEVGYTAIDGTATEPWNYTRDGDPDEEEQRRCYAAFTGAWKDAPAGVMFWSWSDPKYTPKSRPAETVVRAWFDR